MLGQPQLPRPTGVPRGSTWESIWQGLSTLSKQDQNLSQYLQSYITTLYHFLIPTQVIVSIVSTTPYTVNATDGFIGTPSGVVNLPPASGSGRVLIIKNLDPNGAVVTVTPNGTDTIDGQPNYTLVPRYQVLQLVDGAIGQWMIS